MDRRGPSRNLIMCCAKMKAAETRHTVVQHSVCVRMSTRFECILKGFKVAWRVVRFTITLLYLYVRSLRHLCFRVYAVQCSLWYMQS